MVGEKSPFHSLTKGDIEHDYKPPLAPVVINLHLKEFPVSFAVYGRI